MSLEDGLVAVVAAHLGVIRWYVDKHGETTLAEHARFLSAMEAKGHQAAADDDLNRQNALDLEPDEARAEVEIAIEILERGHKAKPDFRAKALAGAVRSLEARMKREVAELQAAIEDDDDQSLEWDLEQAQGKLESLRSLLARVR